MAVDRDGFQRRTMGLALRVIHLVESLPRSETGQVLGRQLLRSATSAGANYRSACRAKSRADMLHKLGIVEEELDETLYWIELLIAGGLLQQGKAAELIQETDEILAMTVASRKTLRERAAQIENRKSKIENP